MNISENRGQQLSTIPSRSTSELRALTSMSQRILESWRRCQDLYQIDPQAKLTVHVLTRSAWRERFERFEHLLAVAEPYVAALHDKLAGLNFCVLMTDGDGATLDLRNGAIPKRDLTHIELVRGACWPEDAVGTGAIGTALYECTPILVHRNEHFHPALFEMSCNAAPICDSGGKVLGVLNATGLHITSDRISQVLIYRMVVHTAAMIENAWFLAQNQDHWVIQSSEQPGAFMNGADPMIAFDESGAVLGGNRAARSSLIGTHGAPLTLHHLLGVQPGDLIYSAHNWPGCVQEICSYRNGTRQRIYVSLRGPTAPSPAVIAGVSGVQAELPHQIAAPTVSFQDPQMESNLATACSLIDKHLPILVLGETGSGKEVFAHAVHENSKRCDKPFVVINCAAIPDTLIESELFGYQQGAFTGAKTKGQRGKILQADGGTLFLDEIGDMPLALQTRLLRVLAEKEITPLGSTGVVKVDANVICATHRDLRAMMEQGQFREDLYYRLNTATVRLPALRERSDLPLLAKRIFAEEAIAAERKSLRLGRDILDFATRYPWPGNIRQLRNIMRYAVALCEDTEVTLAHLPPDLVRLAAAPAAAKNDRPARSPDTAPAVESSGRRDAMLAELRRHRWEVTATAAAMGIPRATFYRRMKRYGIVPPNRLESADSE